MIYPPHDTLAYQVLRPVRQKIDLSNASLRRVAVKAKAFYDAQGDYMKLPVAADEAAEFYVYSQADAVIAQRFHPLEPLPAAELKVINDRLDHMNRLAVRMFYYVLMICTREARHQKNATKKDKLVDKFGGDIGAFFKQNKLGDIDTAPAKFASKAPSAALGKFAEALSWYFYNGSWNSNYGGPAWGKVADCLVEYVHGRLTGEMMIDTAFTLQHNNGPIFNKLMYFSTTGNIATLLDVQRSGQVPALVNSQKEYNHSFPIPVTTLVVDLYKLLGTDFMPNLYVDWFKVKALGGLGNYKEFQKAQLVKYGPSEWANNLPDVKPGVVLNYKYPNGAIGKPVDMYVIPALGEFEKIARQKVA